MNLTSLSRKSRTFNVLYLPIVMIVSSSCEKEFLEVTDNQGKVDELYATITKKTEDSIFRVKKFLDRNIKKNQGRDDDEVYELAAEMHGRNFIPLRPIMIEENEEIVYKQLKERNEELKKE